MHEWSVRRVHGVSPIRLTRDAVVVLLPAAPIELIVRGIGVVACTDSAGLEMGEANQAFPVSCQ